jgi:glycosyltransferase 2 family protein
MRKTISLLVKAAVSGLLLYFALNFVNLETVASRLSRIAPGWALLGLLALLAQILLVTQRWRLIVTQCGGDLPFGQLFRFSMIGTFFNQTLPSSVGGDAMRMWLVAKPTNWRIGTYSVFLDRVVGVTVLAALVVLCLPWTLELVRNPVGRSALLLIGVGSIAAGLIFISLSSERLRILQRWSLTRHLADVATIAVQILRSPRTLAPIVGVTIVVHLLTATAAWAAARSVGANLSLPYALFLVLPVMLVAIVPISIAGWGVREGAMVAAFAYAGLPEADGLIVSLLFGAGTLLLGAAGGMIWVLTGERGKRPVAPDVVGE